MNNKLEKDVVPMQEGADKEEPAEADAGKRGQAEAGPVQGEQAEAGSGPRGPAQDNGKADWNIKPYLAVGLTSFMVIVLSIIVFFFIYRYHGLAENWGVLLGILQPIIMGFVIAYLVNPIVKWMERYLTMWLKSFMKQERKIRRTARALSVAGALVFLILIIAVLLAMVIPELYTSIERVAVSLPGQVDAFISWVTLYVEEESELTGYLESILNRGVDFFENWAQTELFPQTKNILTLVTSGAISVVRALFNFVIGLVISIYVLLSKETFIAQAKKVTYAIFPADKGNVLISTVRRANQIFGGFISGKILDSLIIGILCFIGLSVLRMPYTLLVSVIVGVTNVIPFFGPYIGAVPSAILIMLANPIQGLYFILFILVLQQLDGNVIGPKILGDSTGLNSFWVVFAILVGGGLFGVAGMIFGVPLFATIYDIFKKLTAWVLRRKGLPEDTSAYKNVAHIDENTGELHIMEPEQKKAKSPRPRRKWKK